jgi:hypothetical protein
MAFGPRTPAWGKECVSGARGAPGQLLYANTVEKQGFPIISRAAAAREMIGDQ